jgi:hypothetical protein
MRVRIADLIGALVNYSSYELKSEKNDPMTLKSRISVDIWGIDGISYGAFLLTFYVHFVDEPVAGVASDPVGIHFILPKNSKASEIKQNIVKILHADPDSHLIVNHLNSLS